MFNSPYLIYFYAFLILFSLGIGAGLIRNNFKKNIERKNIVDNSVIINENQNVSNKDSNQNEQKEFLTKSEINLLIKSL